MSSSVDPGHFFQTDASEATRARRAAKSGNKEGNPIVLQSKILNAIADPFSPDSIYIAESASCIRRINMETRDTKTVYRGPTAPVTSVAIGGAGGNTIFGGCWDKDIWSWDKNTRAVGRRYKGHSDFVKTVICARIGDKDCLISGGADAKIIVWDTATGDRLHVLRDKSDNMMAVQDLALDPVDSTPTGVLLVSSSSDPHIRRWKIGLTSASQVLDTDISTEGESAKDTILEHETSVYNVIFSGDEEDEDLWTASADGSAKCLSRGKNWDVEETYTHGDYVRAVVATADWAVTAGRDEDVKIWDRSTGKLCHTYAGHYQEVTGLVLLSDKKVISISIDGTIRSWGLDRAALDKARIEREEKSKGVVKEEKVVPKKSLMTEDEEAELAELMDSDDE
ncbi:WD40-repeat-containing domain protein [Amylocarpus encephaloides]|uniref:WD40-repeat-containing domain protein n=1 Tax=Amylocarpus encephaloides TaxID=45428 RepID=A0A9P8C7G1_9HELO|nr:WD40-repeat-containing domain protein [Amylocarpus encephaloides]